MNSLIPFHAQNQTPAIGSLMALAAYYDFMAPTSLTDADGFNTIDTTGTTTFSRAYDFSGNGRHFTVPSKALAPGYSATEGAVFTGGQNFNRVTDAGVQVYTIAMKVKAATGGSLNALGSFTQHGSNNAAIFFGQSTTAFLGETITISPGGSNSAAFTATGVIPVGETFTVIFQTNIPSIAVDGADAALIQGFAFLSTLDMMLGRRISPSQYFTGSVQKLAIGTTGIGGHDLYKLHGLL